MSLSHLNIADKNLFVNNVIGFYVLIPIRQIKIANKRI